MKPTCCWIRFFSCLFLMAVISACQPTVDNWPTLRGQVLDKATGNPLSNAIVVTHWRGRSITTTICFHVDSTTTDKRGQFEIPAWINTGKWKVAEHQYMEVKVYKSGYKIAQNEYHMLPSETSYQFVNIKGIAVKSLTSDDYTHKLITETSDVKTKILSLLVFFNGCSNSSDQVTFTSMQAVYDEIKNLATNTEEKGLLDVFYDDLVSRQ